ncbi:MAG: hypothetical protein ACI4J7_05520 [Ruminiclostridium sp.]
MSKKKRVVKQPETVYRCRWCDKDKAENRFYHCAITHKSFICKSCINRKYNELDIKYGKDTAIYIICHYLDIPYYSDCVKSLGADKGIGYYIKQLNLMQNDIENFEMGIIKNNCIDFAPPQYTFIKAKYKLNDIIDRLKEIRDLF